MFVWNKEIMVCITQKLPLNFNETLHLVAPWHKLAYYNFTENISINVLLLPFIQHFGDIQIKDSTAWKLQNFTHKILKIKVDIDSI